VNKIRKYELSFLNDNNLKLCATIMAFWSIPSLLIYVGFLQTYGELLGLLADLAGIVLNVIGLIFWFLLAKALEKDNDKASLAIRIFGTLSFLFYTGSIIWILIDSTYFYKAAGPGFAGDFFAGLALVTVMLVIKDREGVSKKFLIFVSLNSFGKLMAGSYYYYPPLHRRLNDAFFTLNGGGEVDVFGVFMVIVFSIIGYLLVNVIVAFWFRNYTKNDIIKIED